jgi:hypothetical protein
MNYIGHHTIERRDHVTSQGRAKRIRSRPDEDPPTLDSGDISNADPCADARRIGTVMR